MNFTARSSSRVLHGCSAILLLALAAGCTADIHSPGGAQANQGGAATTGGQSNTGNPTPGAGNGSITTPGVGNPPAPGTDPGRVTLHRLNRAEYNNTVRDLLGTTSSPADVFPLDDRGNGFDNMADVLTLSPLHLSLYQAAAVALVDAAFADATARAKLVPCNLTSGATCARQTLEAIMPRAWRRPVQSTEVDELFALVTLATGKGDSAEQGLKLALEAVLLSPHFLFRVELDPEPTSTTPHPLNAYELANRLSYFLWSTMPDAELTASAAAGNLAQPDTLKAQLKRMIESPKGQAFVDNFAGQWLETRKTEEVQPNTGVFPKFDEPLRTAMIGESKAFFKDLLLGTLTGTALLDSDYTYANDRLATHYGLPAVGSTTMTRVSVPAGGNRGGVLGQGSFLTVTSHATRTSPVLRGKWVLNQLLCTDIPPPPVDADMNAFEAAAMAKTGGTLRQTLEQHRADPKCASCHNLMDPIGFGLENYDAIGAYRTMEGSAAIDATGTTPDGSTFAGMRDLAKLVAKDARYPGCFVGKVYTYALGRSPADTANHMDPNIMYNLASNYAKGGMHLPDLLNELVASNTFLNRRGEPE